MVLRFSFWVRLRLPTAGRGSYACLGRRCFAKLVTHCELFSNCFSNSHVRDLTLIGRRSDERARWKHRTPSSSGGCRSERLRRAWAWRGGCERRESSRRGCPREILTCRCPFCRFATCTGGGGPSETVERGVTPLESPFRDGGKGCHPTRTVRGSRFELKQHIFAPSWTPAPKAFFPASRQQWRCNRVGVERERTRVVESRLAPCAFIERRDLHTLWTGEAREARLIIDHWKNSRCYVKHPPPPSPAALVVLLILAVPSPDGLEMSYSRANTSTVIRRFCTRLHSCLLYSLPLTVGAFRDTWPNL